jgi:hypothetical protein
LQDPPKFTQIWIFVLKTNHLVTLALIRKWDQVNLEFVAMLKPPKTFF